MTRSLTWIRNIVELAPWFKIIFRPVAWKRVKHISSVPDPDPGSGAFLTSGSGIRNRFFSGSRIPNPYFWELRDNFLGKKFYNSLKIGPNFFLQQFKTKIMYNFVKFVATLKGMTSNFFYPSLLLLFLDPGSEIQDPGWVKIRIRDPG